MGESILPDGETEVEKRLRHLEAWREAVETQLEYLRTENEELRESVAELEELVDPDPGATAYEQLTKGQKVHRVRKTLVERADATNGRAAMKYREVMMLFGGHPSAGHCYDLMERAGQLDGFAYDVAGNGDGDKRVRVNLDGVNEDADVHAVNNGTQANPA